MNTELNELITALQLQNEILTKKNLNLFRKTKNLKRCNLRAKKIIKQQQEILNSKLNLTETLKTELNIDEGWDTIDDQVILQS